MDEDKYSLIRKYVIMFTTILITITTMGMNIKLFFDDPLLHGVTPSFLLLMFFSMFSFVLVMYMLLAKKKSTEQLFITQSSDIDVEKENDENYENLRDKIAELEKNISKISGADVEYMKVENAKEAVILRIKKSSIVLKRKINIILENFQKPMQLSLICAISFAIAGLIPLCYLIFKGDNPSIQSSISVVMVSRWPFLGLTLVFEFVAGVFLKIYYRLVDEIKYYTNENIRINEKAIGLETLVRLGRTEGIETFVQQMVNREIKAVSSNHGWLRKNKQKNDSSDLETLKSLIELFSKQQ